MNLLKRLFLPKRFGFKKHRLYHQSRVEFYEGRNSLTRLTSLKNILNSDTLHKAESNQNIQIQNIPFGASQQEILNLKGKPNYVQSEGQILDEITTLFYRENLYGVTCIIQLQFFRDNFFFGTIELRHNKAGFSNSIQQLIQNKYGIDRLVNNSIIDKNGNQIHFSNNIIPTINYLSGSKTIKEEIRGIINEMDYVTEMKSSSQTSKLLDMI